MHKISLSLIKKKKIISSFLNIHDETFIIPNIFLGAKISQFIDNSKKKEKIIVNSGYPRLKPRFKKKESSMLTIKGSNRSFLINPRTGRAFIILVYRTPCVYIAISELVRICGRPEFHRHIFRGRNGRNCSSVTGHRHFDVGWTRRD